MRIPIVLFFLCGLLFLDVGADYLCAPFVGKTYRPEISAELANPRRLHYEFVVFGDTQPRWNEEERRLAWHPGARVVRDAILAEEPDFVLHTGDLVDAWLAWKEGHSLRLSALWQGWLAFYRPLLELAPLWPCRGNHDVACGTYEAFFELAEAGEPERYWTRSFGSIRLVSLDSNALDEFEPGGRQRVWLDRVLSRQGPAHTFVFFHHPPFSVGAWETERSRVLHEALEPHAGTIRAVFNGHDHLYYRTRRDGIAYFVTGGGGFYLTSVREEKTRSLPAADRYRSMHHYLRVEVREDRVRVSCVLPGGEVFDRVDLSP